MNSSQLKLLPFLLLMVTACTNRDETTKKLREEIELKDRQKNQLTAEVADKDASLQAQTAELEALRLTASTEVVAKAEQQREALLAEKAELEASLKAKDAELKEAEKRLRTAEDTQAEMQKSAQALALDIQQKTEEIKALNGKIQELGSDVAETEGLKKELEQAQKDLASLQTSARFKEDELAKENLALKADINAKLAEISALKERITELAGREVHSSALSDAQAKLDLATKQLADLEKAKELADRELTENQKTLGSIMMPVFGMYYGEGGKLRFEDKDCRSFLYVASSGVSTDAVVCGDRVQWSRHRVTEFSALEDKGLVGQIGLRMHAETLSSSCKATSSSFSIEPQFTFEKYLSLQDTSGSGSVRVKRGGSSEILRSTAETLLTEDCEGLLKFASQDSTLDPKSLPLLKDAARVCELVAQTSSASLETGCFTSPTTFVKE